MYVVSTSLRDRNYSQHQQHLEVARKFRLEVVKKVCVPEGIQTSTSSLTELDDTTIG